LNKISVSDFLEHFRLTLIMVRLNLEFEKKVFRPQWIKNHKIYFSTTGELIYKPDFTKRWLLRWTKWNVLFCDSVVALKLANLTSAPVVLLTIFRNLLWCRNCWLLLLCNVMIDADFNGNFKLGGSSYYLEAYDKMVHFPVANSLLIPKNLNVLWFC
jgi:hypothetical protein